MFFLMETPTRTFYDDINDVYHMIISNENTNNILEFLYLDYLYLFQSVLGFVFILSILILIDNSIPYYYETYNKTNKVITTKYPNIYSLLLSETINYLLQLPNLITLFIGIIQFTYTYYINSISLNPILIIILVVLFISISVYSKNHKLKYISIGLSIILLGHYLQLYQFYFIGGKIVNLCVSIACFIFSITREIKMDSSSKKLDEYYNSSKIFSKTNQKQVLAEEINIEEEIELYYHDITPSELEILEIGYQEIGENVNNSNYIADYNIGYYYDKETSGEDVSKLFRVGDIIPPHRLLTRPYIKVLGRVRKLIDTTEVKRKRSQNEALPHFLNTAWLVSDIFAIVMLIIWSIYISINAILYEGEPELILKHIIAATISGNTIIPSMRLILLYNIYLLILKICFSTITINTYQSLKNIENIDQIIFDKTGTLTNEIMYVEKKISHSNDILNHYISNLLDWNLLELEFAISISNSESSIYQNKVWGTSPEENYILDYWKNKGFLLIFNPLSTLKQLEFRYKNTIRTIEIIEREPYCFEWGKLSRIKLDNCIELSVRQHGNDFFDSKYHINDIRRTISIAILNTNNQWEVVTSYIFENPIRNNINNVIEYLDNKNIKSSILTGDGREAAEYIGQSIGFSLDNVFRLDRNNMNLLIESNTMIKTISINGNVIDYYLSHNIEFLIQILNSKNYNKILYRVPNYLKQKIVKLIPKVLYLGDASNDTLAIKDAYIGICLTHGAELCKLNANIIIKEPKYLLDIMKQNGYKDMIITGGQRLLKDICWFSGLVSGFLLTGIHINKFKFLQNSILYQDTWDTLTMIFISSFQYSFSVISYSSSDCISNTMTNFKLSIYSISNILLGIILGLFISGCIKYMNMFHRIDLVLLHSINIMMLIKHSWHCITSKNNRTYNGLFGNQFHGYNKSIIIFIINILDSIPFRIVLYGIFYFCFPLK